MNSEDRERIADQWLDAALARYSNVEPQAGLERRILAHLESRRQARPAWWRLAAVAVAAGLVICAGVLWMARRQQPLPAPVAPVVAAKSSAAPRAVAARPRQATDIARMRRGRQERASAATQIQMAAAARREAEPKRNTFPSPEPLSAAEQAMLQLVRTHPQVAQTMAQVQAMEKQRVERLASEK